MDTFWILFCACLVLLLQGGFLCVESGLTRSKNAVDVALKNALDLLLVTCLYWTCGFTLMYGQFDTLSLQSVFTQLAPNFLNETPFYGALFLFQLTFCATTVTIVSGALTERATFKTYIVLAVVISILLYPLMGRIAWPNPFDNSLGWLAARGFIDPAGSTVIHSLGGWAGLAAIILLGARVGRFDGKKTNLIPGSSPILAMLGVVFFIIGWIGFNGGNQNASSMPVSSIIINTLISGTFAGVSAWWLGHYISKQMSSSERIVNGTLAGLVASCASCFFVSSVNAALIGVAAGMIMMALHKIMLHYRLDDPINVVAVHLGAGIWGTLAVGLLGDLALIDNGLSRGQQLFAQLQGIVICGLITFPSLYIVLLITRATIGIRVSKSAEHIGLNISEHHSYSELRSLLESIQTQQESGDFSYRVPVEPLTEVGHIAGHYNRLVDRFEETFDHLRDIVNDIRDGIISLSEDGIITDINPSASRIFQCPGNELIGRSLDAIIAAKKSNVTHKQLLSEISTLATGHTGYGNYWGKRSNGTLFDIEVSVAGREAKNGKIEYTALIRDVTQRKRLENKIRSQAELTQITLNSIAEGVITCNAALGIVYINEMAAQLTGHENEKVIGKPLTDILQLSTIDYLNTNIKELFLLSEQEHDILHNDYLLHRNNQTPLVIRCNWGKLKNKKGQNIGWVVAIRDVTESRKMQQKLKIQASYDELTGLLNRREFDKHLDGLLSEDIDENTNHFLFYLDLDQFKLVNDTCGHHAGDALLKQIASLIRNQLRRQDIIARLGGDEFGIILPHCDLDRSQKIADNIRSAIKEYRFYWKNKSFSIGVSIGLVRVNHQSGTREEVMSMADAACYSAKDRGRNCVHIYEYEDHEMTRRRDEMQWASRIQRALDEDRFELYYQSIVPIDTALHRGEPHHFEVFIRMRDNNGNTIAPDAFIPSAERYGLMSHLDAWVISHTLAWLGDKQQGNDRYSCSINLSGTSVGSDDCLALIRRKMIDHHIKPNTVCFEITETAAMANLSQAQEFIKQLQNLDCTLALDDFGSGLSSFGYLRHLPVDYLKIDGMFIKELQTNQLDKAIVASINNIAHEMDLKTVAEFVEGPQTMNILKQLGVDYAQGYHIDRPAPLSSLNKTLELSEH